MSLTSSWQAANYAGDGAREPRAIHGTILLLTSGLTPMVTAVLGPVLPKIEAHFADISGATLLVPLALTAPLLVMALLSVFAGALADRIGRKRLLVAATFAYAVLGAAPLWLQSLHAILASRLLMGVTEAVLMTVSTTLIGDYYVGAKRQKIMALQTTVAAGSATVLNVLGGSVGELGWRAPFAIYLLSIPLGVLMTRKLWEPTEHKGESETLPPVRISGSRFPAALIATCAVALLVGLLFLIVPVHLAYLYAALSVRSSAAIGAAYALNSVGLVFGTIVFGWFLAGRFTVPIQLASGALIAGLGCIGMASASGYYTLTGGAIVNGIGIGLLFPAATTWNIRQLAFSTRGTGVGSFQSCLFLGMFLSPIAVLAIEPLAGNRQSAIYIIGAALCCAAIAVLAIANTGVRSRTATMRIP